MAEDRPVAADLNLADRGKYFGAAKCVTQPLPVFSEVRSRIPDPILDAQPQWIAMYWKCQDLAFSHLKQPATNSPLVVNWLDEAFSKNIFQWDTIFMMMFARYAHEAFPAIQSLDNFYALQRPSGYICREYREADGAEVHFDFSGGLFSPTGWKNSVNPPLFSWAECESFKVTGDKGRFARVLPALEKYVEWLNRDGDPDAPDWESNGRRSAGTPHQLYWNTGLGSGMDNTPRPTRKGAGWVDMSCQMVMQYDNLATICRELGLAEKAQRYEDEAKAIAGRINRWCWNEEDGFYYDVQGDGSQFKKKTIGSFWPMIAGVSSPTQTKRLVAHLKDEKTFWRPVVFPTLAASEPEYKADGGYWLGAVWAPTDYAVIKGLVRCGEENFAAQASERYLTAMADVFGKTGTVWENYAPESYAPGKPAAKDFVGWSGIGPITLLIENVLGFRPDGVRRHLVWRLRQEGRHGIRRLGFGGVHTDLVFDGKETITVSSDQPYRLEIQTSSGRDAFEIKAGEQTLRLARVNDGTKAL